MLLGSAFAAVLPGQPPSPQADRQPVLEWKEHAAGGARIELLADDLAGYLILPKKRAPGRLTPWVLYAPVIGGYFPRVETDWLLSRLLENGIAIAGVDVGESYGNPRGVEQFTRFYTLVVNQHHLAPTVSLVAQSRGGLMLYNWAIANPQRVQCIGGIYPVSNLASYPGLARAAGAYGLTVSDMQERLAEFNPIDRLAPLAQRNVPILHLHGDSDTTVPLEANSLELSRRYQSLGGRMQLLVREGKGHKIDPSFFRSQELLDFLVTHARQTE